MKLGHPSPRRMLKEGMDAVDWRLWRTYLALNPVGEERDDARAAVVAQAVWNVQIAKAAGRSRVPVFRKLSEFLLKWGDRPDPETPTKHKQTPNERFDVLRQAFLGAAKALGLKKKVKAA